MYIRLRDVDARTGSASSDTTPPCRRPRRASAPAAGAPADSSAQRRAPAVAAAVPPPRPARAERADVSPSGTPFLFRRSARSGVPPGTVRGGCSPARYREIGVDLWGDGRWMIRCRVSIQSAVQPRAVDLALPWHAEVGLLLPGVVDLSPATRRRVPHHKAGGWTALCGGHCDESMTLHEQGYPTVTSWCSPRSARRRPARCTRIPSAPCPRPALARSRSRGPRPVVGVRRGDRRHRARVLGHPRGAAAGGRRHRLISGAVSILVAWRRMLSARPCGVSVGFVSVAGFLAVPGAGGTSGGRSARPPDVSPRCGCCARHARSLVAHRRGHRVRGGVRGIRFSLAVPGGPGRFGRDAPACCRWEYSALPAGSRWCSPGIRPPFPGDGLGGRPVSRAAATGGHAVFAGLVTGSAMATTLAVRRDCRGVPGRQFRLPDSHWPRC